MSRTLASCLTVGIVTASLCLSPESNAASNLDTLRPGVLAVCLYPGFAPFSSESPDDQWVGWDVSYLEDFAGVEGLRFEPVEVGTFDGIWDQPGRGGCDVAASGISDIADRRVSSGAQAQWSQHYYDVLRGFLVRSDDDHQLTGIDDLRDKTVIVTGNSTADTDLRARLAQAGITTTTILSTSDELDAARQVRDAGNGGEPYAYAGGLGSVQYLASQLGGLAVAWPHCNMLADGAEVAEPFSFVVRSASSGVLDALNRYIADPVRPYGGPTESLPHCPSGPASHP